jgi:hypothetical protein
LQHRKIARQIYNKLTPLWLFVLAICCSMTVALHAQVLVDCSGTNPSAYPSITAALAGGTYPGESILVTGTCHEFVTVNDAHYLNLGAYYGQTATLIGGLRIYGSEGVYVYGMNVSNPNGIGLYIDTSRFVTFDSCTSNANSGTGLYATDQSDINVIGPASFDNNGGGGIQLYAHSAVHLADYAGPTDISNNQSSGIWLTTGSLVTGEGSLTLENNLNIPSASSASAFTPGYGISLFGGSIAQFGTCYGPNIIQGNQAGGASVQENSEFSLWSCGPTYQTFIQNNGPVGIIESFGGQVTLEDSAKITGHSGSGVDLYGKSQLNIIGSNLISKNGKEGNPRSAGIVVDGNSEAFLRGGQITSNHGPGILALVNSSVDVTGATFSDNSRGVIQCDSSAWMASDLAGAGGEQGSNCRIPQNFGYRESVASTHAAPDYTRIKAIQAHYRTIATPVAK